MDGAWTPAGPENDALRAEACCASEPACLLCPLAPANQAASLHELWQRGLYARLPTLGFGAKRDQGPNAGTK